MRHTTSILIIQTAAACGFEAGAAHVEWVGSHTDPSTGNLITNYLYLTDDYVFGATTNVQVINGVPDSFSFSPPPRRCCSGQLARAFRTVGLLFSRSPIRTPTLTGRLLPRRSTPMSPRPIRLDELTTLPSRVQITANELNLQDAIITGQNYLSITASNQFDGSPGCADRRAVFRH